MASRTVRESHAAQSLPASPIGDRLRQLRFAAGLTQSELAGDRFSKEYISQIERGKTRPTQETVDWLASRLGVDAGYLAAGVSADERARAEALLARADAVMQERRYEDAVEAYRGAYAAVLPTGSAELRVRLLAGEGIALAHHGEPRAGLELLNQARALVEDERFNDLDRADVLYRIGICRCLMSSFSTAVGLFGEALALAERSALPCDELRAGIFGWRSRCYRLQRDFEAAREDVERALELAEALHDTRKLGEAYFQASVLAERDGHWVLARTYAEKAKAQYEVLAEQREVGRLHNNLGGLEFLLGRSDEAIAHLKQAFAAAIDVGYDHDAAAAVSSLAQVHLRTGDPTTAEEQARYALRLIGDREDMLGEIGNAQLVLGRALLEQGRLDEASDALALADDTFAKYSSVSHRAAVWVAQGDLVAQRGNESRAAALYRRAAEALQDFRF
ncbi:MAG TPA: tetratricopeptide repeat protein [Gaiellaceae bacterium]|nr:tetratricopeptide repeat protein [Gaiellaceae bacterium]